MSSICPIAPPTEILKKLSGAYEALPKEKYGACNPLGSLPNPINVALRSHEQKAMVFRYILWKLAEYGANEMLMSGCKVQFNLPGTENFGIQDPIDLNAVRKSQMSGVILAIRGQVRAGQWFYLAGEPSVVYFLDEMSSVFWGPDKVKISKVMEDGVIKNISADFDKIFDDIQLEKKKAEDFYNRPGAT